MLSGGRLANIAFTPAQLWIAGLQDYLSVNYLGNTNISSCKNNDLID